MVIGAGIVGAATAWELLKDGHRVTLLDPGPPGGPQAASFGNGGWISPASVVPMALPGLWRQVPRMLRDPSGPLTLRWSALPALTPWLVRFLWAGWTLPKVHACAQALSGILHDGPQRHAALAAEIGRPELIRQTGLLYAYRDRNAFAADALAWSLRRDCGVGWTELEAEAVRTIAPALGAQYRFGALVENGAHCRDPGGYVAAIAAAAQSRGAALRIARATGFAIGDRRLRAVLTDAGPIACDRAVIAAGIHSRALARAAGDRIPLVSERGYHCVVPAPAPELDVPVMPADGRMANTGTTAGLRLSGQVELAGIAAAPDWRRADILLRHAASAYPGAAIAGRTDITRWMGHRPSTPDGRPVIGPAHASPDITHAFGHGHIGLAAGPATGRIVADGIAGRTPHVAMMPFAARRF